MGVPADEVLPVLFPRLAVDLDLLRELLVKAGYTRLSTAEIAAKLASEEQERAERAAYASWSWHLIEAQANPDKLAGALKREKQVQEAATVYGRR